MKRTVAKLTTGLLACLCCFTGFVSCGEKEEDGYVVYMPDGAPALALAGVMAEDEEGDGFVYKVVNPQLITSKITNEREEENADFCVLPSTAAGKYLGTGDRYVMLGALTHGNLYLISKTGAPIAHTSELIGKKVGVLQMAAVPGLTFKATLDKYSTPWQELTNGAPADEERVNLIPLAGPEFVGQTEADYYLLAEPAVSVRLSKGYSLAGDLQALYGGNNGYPQAVLVAKKAIALKEEGLVVDFIEQIEESLPWVMTASGKALVDTVQAHFADRSAKTSLNADYLSGETLSRCGIRFSHAALCAEETSELLTALKGVSGGATEVPLSNFYWKYTK